MVRLRWFLACCAILGMVVLVISCEPVDDVAPIDPEVDGQSPQFVYTPAPEATPYYLQEPVRTPLPPRPAQTNEERLALVTGQAEAPVNQDVVLDPLPEQALAAIATADSLIEAGDYEMARQRLERAMGFAPEHLEIHRRLADVHFQMGNYGNAVMHFRRVLRFLPDDLELQLAMGEVCASQGSYSQALRYTRQAVLTSEFTPSDPSAAVAMSRLAQMLERRDEIPAALAAYELLAGWLDQYAETYQGDARVASLLEAPGQVDVDRARLLMTLGYSEEAVPLLENAYAELPAYDGCEELLLRALGQTGGYRRGEELLAGGVAEAMPVNAVEQILRGLARQTCRDREFQDSLVFLSGLSGRHPQWSALIEEIVRVYYAPEMDADEIASFSQYATTLAADDPRAPKAFYLAGLLARRIGQETLAEEWLERATQAQPEFLPAQEALFDVWISRGRGDLAVQRAHALSNGAMDRWMQEYLMGKALLAVDNAEGAAAALDNAAEDNPEYQPVFLLLSQAMTALENTNEAISAMDRAVSIDPTRPGILDEWMMLYYGAGRLTLFRTQQAPRYLRDRSDDLQVRMMQIKLHLLNNEPAQARELMLLLARSYPDDLDVRLLNIYADLWLARPAEVATPSGSQEAAAAPRNETVVIEEVIGGRQVTTYTTYNHGRTPAAGIEPVEASIVDPNGLGLASWIDEVPQWALTEAWEQLAPLLETHSHDRRVRLMSAQVLLGLGRAQEARALWHGLYVLDPGDPVVVDGYVSTLLACEDHRRAVEVLQDAREQLGDSDAIRLRLVDVLESTQRYDSAISELQSWLEQGSVRNTGQTNYLQYRLFHCALSGGYGQLARNALNSLSGMAGSPFYTRLEAQWALETGDYAAATALVVDHLDRFMTADEYLASGEGGLVLAAQLQVGAIGLIVDDARAQLARLRGDSQHLDAGSPVVWLWQMGRREDVLELMVRIAQLPDSSPTLRDWANWQRLVMLMADNRTAEGLEILNIGIANKLEVSRSQYRTLKFVYLLLAEREDDAEAYLGEWIADAPYDILPRSMLAYLMDRQGRLEEFLEVLDLWLAGSEPAGGDMEEDWMRLGLLRLKISVLYDLRRNDDMIDCLAQAMELAPDDVSLQMLYASVLDDAGRFTEAIAIMDEALEADPRNPELLNNMAYMLAEGGIRLREAEVMINRALYEGVNAAYLDTKGWVLYKQGRIQPARRVLENTLVEARRTGMESPVLYDHAGDAYYRDGDVEQAREMWARAVELGDGSVVLTADDEDVLVLAAAKLAALDAGQVPRVAPLGQGVPDPLYPQEVEPIVAAPVAPGEDVDPVEGNE